MTDYPKNVNLKDGSSITLRLLGREDFEASLDFFRRQPEKDRIYLRRDVTRREVIESRFVEIEAGLATVIVAEAEGKIVGDALLYCEKRGWFRKTGELRLVVDTGFRGKGLGTLLAKEIIDLAEQKGLFKLEASYMETQEGISKTLEPLGFALEGSLSRFVVDLRGREHDLLLMGMKLPSQRNTADK